MRFATIKATKYMNTIWQVQFMVFQVSVHGCNGPVFKGHGAGGSVGNVYCIDMIMNDFHQQIHRLNSNPM